MLSWIFGLLTNEYIDIYSASGQEVYLANLNFSRFIRLAKDLKIQITLPLPNETVYARLTEIFLPGKKKFWNDDDYMVAEYISMSIAKSAGHYDKDFQALFDQSLPFHDSIGEFIVKTTLFSNHCPDEFLLTPNPSQIWKSSCIRRRDYLILILYNLKKATPEQLDRIDWSEFINKYIVFSNI
jgi:hypothetical protein